MKGAGEWLETEWWDKEFKEKHGVKEHDEADWDWIDGETWEEKDVEQDARKEHDMGIPTRESDNSEYWDW